MYLSNYYLSIKFEVRYWGKKQSDPRKNEATSPLLSLPLLNAKVQTSSLNPEISSVLKGLYGYC